jgi:hypothetical protein
MNVRFAVSVLLAVAIGFFPPMAVSAQGLRPFPPTPEIVPANGYLRAIELPLFDGLVRVGPVDDFGTARSDIAVRLTTQELTRVTQWNQGMQANQRAYLSLLFLKHHADVVASLDPTAFPARPQGGARPRAPGAAVVDQATLDAYAAASGMVQALQVIATTTFTPEGFTRFFCVEPGRNCDITLTQLERFNGTTAGGAGQWAGFSGNEFDRLDAYRDFMSAGLPALLAAARELPDELLLVTRVTREPFDFQAGGFPVALYFMGQANVGILTVRHDPSDGWGRALAETRSRMLAAPEALAREIADMPETWAAVRIRVTGPGTVTTSGNALPPLAFVLVEPFVRIYENGSLTREIGRIPLE